MINLPPILHYTLYYLQISFSVSVRGNWSDLGILRDRHDDNRQASGPTWILWATSYLPDTTITSGWCYQQWTIFSNVFWDMRGEDYHLYWSHLISEMSWLGLPAETGMLRSDVNWNFLLLTLSRWAARQREIPPAPSQWLWACPRATDSYLGEIYEWELDEKQFSPGGIIFRLVETLPYFFE